MRRTTRLSVVAAAIATDLRDAPRAARRAGFHGLLFDAYSNSLSFPELSASGRREFRRLLEAEKQQLIALRCDLDARGLAPGADVDRALNRLERACEAAAALAAGVVCVDLGPLPAPATERPPRPRVTPEQAGLIILPPTARAAAPAESQPATAATPDPAFVAQVDQALVELGQRADRFRVTVALSASLASFAALERALSAAACPWFGVELDPVAILRDEWNIDQTFSALGPLIRHVRARDAAAGADRRTRPVVIGGGSVDWQELLNALEATSYRGAITVDPTDLPDRAAAAVAARHFLEQL